MLAREVDWTLLPPTTPAHIHTLLRRCLEKDPRKRLRDIGDARMQLDEPAAAAVSPHAATPRATSVARLLPWGVAAASVVGAALLFLWYPEKGEVLDRPVIRMIVDWPSEAEPGFRPVLAPDGSFVARVLPGSRVMFRCYYTDPTDEDRKQYYSSNPYTVYEDSRANIQLELKVRAGNIKRQGIQIGIGGGFRGGVLRR